MINTYAFKRGVLDLATSGQLSEHQEGDTPVEDVLCKLPQPSARRKKLLSQNITMDPVGKIPEHWQWLRLGEISSYGDTPEKRKPADITDDTWILDLEDIESGGRLLARRLGAERKTKGERTAFHRGQVLYSKLRPYLKKTLVADSDGVSTPELVAFDVFANINPVYITYCLTNTYTDAAIEKRSYGIKMPRIDPAFMANLPIPVPPIEEQARIVEIVSQVMNEIDRIDSMQAAYITDAKLLEEEMIDAGIRGKLTADWRIENGLSQDSWTNETIGTCFDVVGGIQKKPERAPKNNPVPYVTVANVFRNHIDLADLRYFELFDGELERLQLRDKDILVVEGNGSGGEIGRCAMWENQIPVCVHQNHIIRLRCTDDQVLPEYVLLFLNSPTGKAVVRERAKTTTGLYNLSAGKIRSIPVPLPSLEEQKRIVERVDELLRALPE